MWPALGLDPRVAANHPASYTGHYLEQVLKRRSSSKAGGKRPAETQGRGVNRREDADFTGLG